jgi:hypothetical protein
MLGRALKSSNRSALREPDGQAEDLYYSVFHRRWTGRW